MEDGERLQVKVSVSACGELHLPIFGVLKLRQRSRLYIS